MRLDEIQTKYYIGTNERQLPGWLLRGRTLRPRDPDDRTIEELLEKFRPTTQMSRHKTYFMNNSPDPEAIKRINGHNEKIYQVNPVGPIYRNDANWLNVMRQSGLYSFMDGNEKELPALKQIAEYYWQGRASDNPQWEFRAEAVGIEAPVEKV